MNEYLRSGSLNLVNRGSLVTRQRWYVYSQKEVHLYGGSRLGIDETERPLMRVQVSEVWNPFNGTWCDPVAVQGQAREVWVNGAWVGENTPFPAPNYERFVDSTGKKRYELSNHLGNVLAVVSDRKLPQYQGNLGVIAYYEADQLSLKLYDPFGTIAQEWRITGTYRYSFNGKESDSEWDGGGAMFDYGFRIYDPRLCRFLSVDPLTESYPWYTPYQFAGNVPIACDDLDGMEPQARIYPTPEGISSYYYTVKKHAEANIAEPWSFSSVFSGRKLGGYLNYMAYYTVNDIYVTLQSINPWEGDYVHNLDGTNPGATELENAKMGAITMATFGPISRVVKYANTPIKNIKNFNNVVKRGKITMEPGATYANKSEEKWANILADDGHDVQVLKEKGMVDGKGARTPDFKINGEHGWELKEVSNLTGIDMEEGLLRVIQRAHLQSKNLIIDVTGQPGMTSMIAQKAAARAFGSRSDFQNFRIRGQGFELKLTREWFKTVKAQDKWAKSMKKQK